MFASERENYVGGEGLEGMERNEDRGGIVRMIWQIFLLVEVATYLRVFAIF